MIRPSNSVESSELIQLRQQVRQNEIKERQSLLREFLGNVKEMIKREAKEHLSNLDEGHRSPLIQPQVFISYAWEAAETPKLTHLQTLLSQIDSDLAAAGIITWFDKKRMTGDIAEQMRAGIQESDYALLIGTHRYAERTQPDSKTNVRKELDFTLAKAKENPNFLLPLMLEGDYGTTFPTVGQYLIRDCKSWYSLEQGQWQSQEKYIQDLTKSESEGILYCLLGLNRCERSLIKYRQACLKQYQEKQQALMNALQLLSQRTDASDGKPSPHRPLGPSIQLTPVLQIPFEALEYDKKADKIGSGSYGEVYRGWWQGQQTVAIKALTGSLTADAEKDLYREAGIMAYVAKGSKEPYPAVRLFGLAAAKPDYALVMEYLPHGTLFDLLQTQSEAKLPWDLRYQLAIDIADGIALLHRQQILHCDLRSHNVLLTITDGHLRAKLSDFGLSIVKSSVRATTTTKKMDSVGTRAWMAPELHKRGGQSSPASDMYSYGMVLWELLTHAIPFTDAQGDPSLISEWISKGETETIPGECPPKLAELIKKCWSLRPEDRPTIEIVQKELAALAKAHLLSAETQAIIKKLQENQKESEAKWNARRQGKPQMALGQTTDSKQETKLDAKEREKPQDKDLEVYDLVLMAVNTEQQIDVQKIKEFLKENKGLMGKPILIKQGDGFILYGLSEQGKWKLTHGLDVSKFKNLKFGDSYNALEDNEEKLILRLSEITARRDDLLRQQEKQPHSRIEKELEIRLKQIDDIERQLNTDQKSQQRDLSKNKFNLVIIKTKGGGDCALHAILGEWNKAEEQLVCSEIKEKRAQIRTAIMSKDNKSDMKDLIGSGIKELIMSGRNDIGKFTQELRKGYRQFLNDQKDLPSQSWSQFEAVLQQPQHQVIMDYIQKKHQLNKTTSSPRDQFHDALNKNNGELYGCILSLPTLHEAFQEYNQLQKTEFDWDYLISENIKQEYADFLGTPHNWLLPSELAIIAHVFHVTVIYYPSPNSFPLTLNPGEKSIVEVQFNGINHFERLESSYYKSIIILPRHEIPKEVSEEITLKKGHTPQEQIIAPELEIEKPEGIAHLQKQDDAKKLALQKQMEQLKSEKRAELERSRAKEVKEIQRPPVKPKNKLPPTAPKKEQELKKVTPLLPSLSGSSQTLMPAPQPVIPRLDRGIQSVDAKALKQLLQYVAEGEQDKAKALIRKEKNLLLHAETVTDLSGREFKQITAFQYALWAMDWHMWTMIQKYLPKEAQAEQFQALETKGTSHGKHFSLQGLTDALQKYVDNTKWNRDQRAVHQLCKVVGEEQMLLPAHVANEYCRPDKTFDPCPQEWESKLPRTLSLRRWNSTQSKSVMGSWFVPPPSKDDLGHTYGFYRYKLGGGMAGEAGLGYWEGLADLKALQSLWKTRTQQLESLKSQLLSTTNQDQELKELKYETPVQISQIIPQTILPPPKPKATPEQLVLQDQLIAACKQGDEKAVKELLQQGAKPDIANAKGEQPLGAAVWGMCPDVVNTLLKQASGVTPMTWDDCEEHNLERYGEVFIVSLFSPQTWREWYYLLLKIDSNPFIRSFHLKKSDEFWRNKFEGDWNKLMNYVALTFPEAHDSYGTEWCVDDCVGRGENGAGVCRFQNTDYKINRIRNTTYVGNNFLAQRLPMQPFLASTTEIMNNSFCLRKIGKFFI